MSDESTDPAEAKRLRERRERMSGSRRRGGNVWALLFFLLLFGFAAMFVVFPEQARQLLGLGTSTSEDIQKTSRVDNSGISTQIQPEPEIVVETPTSPIIEAISSAPVSSELDQEAKARLEALEKALQDIANRPAPEGGPTADDIKKLLDQQAAALRAEAETREQLLKAQLDALRAQTSRTS